MDENILNTSVKLAHISLEEKTPLSDLTNTTKVLEGKESLPDKDSQEKYNKLITKAKKYTGEGQVRNAMEMNKEALKICYSEKLAKKIAKMEAYLKEYGEDSGEEEEEEEVSGLLQVGNGFYLYKDLYNRLYTHQKEGILWMWTLHKRKKGGILGDDMGLGKTIQVIAFLSGMFDMERVNHILIVMPVALVVNWENEFNKWAPGINVTAYHGSSKRERERSLTKVQRRGGVCITTYGMVVTSWEQLGQKDGREFVWDYMILDEGHKIKNPTKTTKGVHNIPAKNRLILTGTPIQNNLKELWSLFDFAHHGTLLGTARTFKMEFDTPITRSREKDATVYEKRLGSEMSEALKKIISPYFLRRTKAEVTRKKLVHGEMDEGTKDCASMPTLTRKNELVIWLFLTQTQQKIYEDFLELDDVKELLMTTKSPLVALTVLKKICDHPRLLSTRACAQLGLDGHEGLDEDMLDAPEALESAATKIQYVADDILIQESGKLIVLIELLDNLKSEGHRCLVFSQSRKMLDIIQKLITNRGHKIMRLDGTVTHVADREQRIQKFQTDDRYTVFLLTTQVGGVGLTLTAADRVVIYDPSWNPATDAQAVDRVFRIGQDKNVVIYRLITCGTVEEKIYRRQIFKDSINRQTTGNSKNPYRYFTKQDLKELFKLETPRHSTTQQQLQEMHTTDRRSDNKLDAHIAYLHSLEIFGVSDHDLMFSQEIKFEDEEEEDTATQSYNNTGSVNQQSNDYIQSRIQRAQQLIEMESSAPQNNSERFPEKKATTFTADRQNVPAFIPKPTNTISHNTFIPPRVVETIDLTSNSTPVKNTCPQSPICIDEEEMMSPIDVKNVKIKKEYDVKTETSKQLFVTRVKEEEMDMSIKEENIESDTSIVSENSVSPNISSNHSPIKSSDNKSIDGTTDDLRAKPSDMSGDWTMDNQTKQSDMSGDWTMDNQTVVHLPNDNVNIAQSKNIDLQSSSNHNSAIDNSHRPEKTSNSECRQDSKQRHNISSPRTSVSANSPFKVPEIPVNSPFRTPKQKERVIEEELIISPDASSPLLSLQPRSGISRNLYMSSQGVRLNMSLMGRSPDSPFPRKPSSTSSDLQSTLVQDSPLNSSYESQKSTKTLVDESPVLSNLSKQFNSGSVTDDISPIVNSKGTPCIEDSCEESESDIEAEESPIVARKSMPRRKVIGSSDEEDNLVENQDDEEMVEDEDMFDEDDDEEDVGSEEEPEGEDVEHESNDNEVNGHGDEDEEYDGSFIDDDDEDDEEESDDDEGSEDEEDGFESLTEDLKLQFNECVDNCRLSYKAKDYETALAFVLQGLEIFPDPDLQKQALKIHQKINNAS
ncbi:DNA excision repair protein ERCC-6-like [Patella vulgata]|uniref:DNA excision repair protein ERCC-6-like n=1 Tax=Patella vulgata TaxID=6465 RepID=UPI00217FA414|nr:DNA excision repair protein ERCC-6-like [Patella vulgata]